MVYKIFGKKPSSGIVKNEIISNKQLAGELNEAIIRKFKKRKAHSLFIDNELGNEFYNRSMKSFLQNNDIEMYSTHNEGKSIIAKRFFRTLKSKIYKYMTSVSKNVYIDKLDDIVNK